MEESIFKMIEEFNSTVTERIYLDDTLQPLADKITSLVFGSEDDDHKEEYSLIAIKSFHYYIKYLLDKQMITGRVYRSWWDKIKKLFSIYTSNINENTSTVRALCRILSFIENKGMGQDTREFSAPETLTRAYLAAKSIVSFMESSKTIEILQSRIPRYLIQDTVESSNGGTVNERKLNSLTKLLYLLGDESDYTDVYREGDLNETNEFSPTTSVQDVDEDI